MTGPDQERRRFSVGVVKIPYADRDLAHRVLTPRDDRGFRDVIGADTADHDSRFPVGAEVSYSVELTAAEAEEFAAASNARYVEPDRVNRPHRAIGRPTGTPAIPTDATWAYMRARYIDMRRWHGRDVRVAVLDQGTTAAVREKMGWTLVARTVTGGVKIAAGEEIGRPVSDHEHGCLVAPNAVPAGGLLLDCVIVEDEGFAFDSAQAAGIRWAVDNGAKVINLSFGGDPGTATQVMLDAADYAATSGVQIVMSAGNENLADLGSPSSMSRTKTNCHSSIAFDESTDRRALFSNHHADGSGCAPGVDVRSFDPFGNRVYWNGTSASSPHMAQLIARGCTGGTYTPTQVAAALRANPRDTGAGASEQGRGAWDLQRALAALGAIPTTPTTAGVEAPSVIGAAGAAGAFSSYNIAAPAGIAADDVRIVVLVTDAYAEITVPDGWTMLLEEHYYAGWEFSEGITVDPVAVFVLAKPYVVGEPSPAVIRFVPDSGLSALGCLTVRAAGGLDPERFSPQVRFGVGSSIPALPVLPATTNDLLVCAYAQLQAEASLATLSVPAALTQRGFWRPTSGSTGYPLLLATAALASGARTTAHTSTANASGTWCSVAFTVSAGAAPVTSTASPGDAPGSAGGFLPFYPVGAASAAGAPVEPPASPSIPQVSLAGIGADLVSRASTQTVGGKAWASSIQAPNRQTDRDVGAAGIAMGLFALADVTADATEKQSYVDAAKAACDWLVATRTATGWPDYHNGASDISTTRFTSFDDGIPGIADALWLAWERTGVTAYQTAALAGMDRLVAIAETPATGQKRWNWWNTTPADYQYGMGQGIPGIVYALRTFADRTGSSTYATQANEGAAFIQSLIAADGGIPEAGTEPVRNTGFLSGAAGIAFMFLRMYQSTGVANWLTQARRVMAFLESTAISTNSGTGLKWPISILSRSLTADDDGNATGMEEGAAGIGWVYLNMWQVTGEVAWLTQARKAGVWLLSVAATEAGGKAWADQLAGDTSTTFHLSVNAGTAGVGWFLYDLGLATGEQQFYDAAAAARTWALAQDTNNSWPTTRVAGTWQMPNEPSWHWGTAGVFGFLARLNGWPVDSPGMEPSITGPHRP